MYFILCTMSDKIERNNTPNETQTEIYELCKNQCSSELDQLKNKIRKEADSTKPISKELRDPYNFPKTHSEEGGIDNSI